MSLCRGALSIACCAALAACDDPTAPGPSAATIRIHPAFAVLGHADTVAPQLELRDAAGQVIPVTVDVTIRDTAVAMATAGGIAARAPGLTDVVIGVPGVRDSMTVAVVAPGGYAIALLDSAAATRTRAAAGDTVAFVLTATPAAGSDASVGSLEARVTFDPARLAFVGATLVAPGWTLFTNVGQAATGTVRIAAFSAEGDTGALPLVRFRFRLTTGLSGPAVISLSDVAGGSAEGLDLTSVLVPVGAAVLPRAVTQ